MKKAFIWLVIVMLGTLTPLAGSAAEKPSQSMIDFAHSELVKLGEDPTVIGAVKAENAKGKSPDEIKKIDKKWINTPGIADFMSPLMDSECGKHLLRLQETTPYFAEIFVMDNQGALVAMTNKTSDYWQGDEAKFRESYKGGTGGVHISDVTFDDSAQTYLVQVSVPVRNDEGLVIGAMTVGIDMDKFEGTQ